MPDRVYEKEELIGYLHYGSNKFHQLISALPDDEGAKRWVDEFRNYHMIEILLYNMRHAKHHAAQLNLLLRQRMNEAPGWVSKAQRGL